MRLFFSIFIFTQLFNFLVLYAEELKKKSAESNLIKWELVPENKSNNLKKIMWKSYMDDETYFKNEDLEVISDEKVTDVNDNNSNNFLDKNEALLHGGLTVENALIPERGSSQLSFNYGSSGSLFSSYKYSLSDIFQIQFISGSHKGISSGSEKNLDLRNTF